MTYSCDYSATSACAVLFGEHISSDSIKRKQTIQERQGVKIGCIEEAAYSQGFIDSAQLEKIAELLVKSGYGKYLLGLTN